jgi:2-dehydro-3-deoxygluconokinase
MKKIVTFGEILMRMSPPSLQRIEQAHQFNVVYAGSEANVSASCSKLGMTAAHVTVLPDDEVGNAAIAELSSQGVNTEFIQRSSGRMGIYFYENAASLRSPKIIYDRFHSAFAAIQPGSVDWEQVLSGVDWFHWTGITPAVSANAASVCKEALLAARKNGVKISGDINYRRVLWQYGKSAQDVMPELIEYCDVIVGGVEDFKNCAGIDETSFEKACEKIVKQFPSVKKIATTFRETISASHQFIEAALWSKSTLLKSSRYELFPIVDRIGAGDAFMAGLIVGEISGKSDQQALEFAAAACALKHTIEGDVNIASKEEIEALMQKNNTGKLLR